MPRLVGITQVWILWVHTEKSGGWRPSSSPLLNVLPREITRTRMHPLSPFLPSSYYLFPFLLEDRCWLNSIQLPQQATQCWEEEGERERRRKWLQTGQVGRCPGAPSGEGHDNLPMSTKTSLRAKTHSPFLPVYLATFFHINQLDAGWSWIRQD